MSTLVEGVAEFISALYNSDPTKPLRLSNHQISVIYDTVLNAIKNSPEEEANVANTMIDFAKLAEVLQAKHNLFFMQLTDTIYLVLPQEFWIHLLKTCRMVPDSVL
jgi:negative regulator of genetic competence, sporulation and motility